MSQTYTIGYHRADGDFTIVATLNNNAGSIHEFNKTVQAVFNTLQLRTGETLELLVRQDTPDCITL